MKRWFVFVTLGCIIAFSGCSVNQTEARECVTDVWQAPATPGFSLQAEVPEEAVLTGERGSGKYYAHRDYEIITEVFPAASAAEGVSHLTGRDSVSAVLLQDFPQEEYRFSWTAAGENGAVACACAMFFDGSYCYALQIQCPVEKEKVYREQFYEILASAGILSGSPLTNGEKADKMNG